MSEHGKPDLVLSYEHFDEITGFDEETAEKTLERFAKMYDILVGLTEADQQRYMTADARRAHRLMLGTFEFMLGNDDENPIEVYFDIEVP